MMMAFRCWKRCELIATATIARMTITTAMVDDAAEVVVEASALMTARIAMMTVISASAQATYPAKRLGFIASHIPAETEPLPPPRLTIALKAQISSRTQKNVAGTGA